MKDLRTIVDENRDAAIGILPNEHKLRREDVNRTIRLSLSSTPYALALRANHATKRLNRRAALLAAACGGASNPETLRYAKRILSETLNPAVAK